MAARHITTSMARKADTPKIDGNGGGNGNGGAPVGEILAEPLRRALGERYLTYALSTITDRALPDARDGLKPVHRRILFGMRGLGLNAGGAFRKCAKITGEVMGTFHPHGNQAIYDALARLAQDFNMRLPLVDGQGNFGNIDGDNPAAERYTEARLTRAAEALMEGLAEDAVDFRPNYDGTASEPVVLPSGLPNLLINGAAGIAVGMATNIPPHNPGEAIDAAILAAKRQRSGREIALDEALRHLPGPDFPTGGVIVEPGPSIRETYATGRGAFRVRARWQTEDLGRGQWQIVVTEIPFQVPKGRLIEKLAELINAKKVPILADVRDESAEDVRIVLEPRARNVDPAVLMETLFRLSDLETRFSLNMNVLVDGRTPAVCTLPQVLTIFVRHRREVLVRRSRHRLDKIAARLEVLDGYIIAYLNLDEVIRIIRTEDEPRAVLMQTFELSEVQADAILNMRLRNLRKLEEMELRREREALMEEELALEALVADEGLQWDRIVDELKAARAAFAEPRRSTLADAPEVEEVPLEAMIEREPVTVVCSEMGWIRAMKGHLGPDAELKYRDGDKGRSVFHAETTDRLLLFGSNGRFYTLAVSTLPGGRGMGEPVRLMLDLPNEARIVALMVHRPGSKWLVASSAGDGFVVAGDEALAQTRAGKQVLNLGGAAEARVCRPATGDHVAVVGENRKVLVFPLQELPEMTRGKGVRLQKYKDGGLADARVFALAEGLQWKEQGGRTRTQAELAEWLGKRAGSGRMAPRGFPRDNRFTD